MTQQNSPQERILRLPQVKALTGLGRSSIYAKIKDGSFPKHINLSARCVGWLESEINSWVAERITASRSST